jgi:hypothetical protein
MVASHDQVDALLAGRGGGHEEREKERGGEGRERGVPHVAGRGRVHGPKLGGGHPGVNARG